MECRTRLSHYLQSSLSILDAPPGVVSTEAASIDVRPSEVTNVPEREAPASVLEMDHSKVGEHLPTAKVEPGKEPAFSA